MRCLLLADIHANLAALSAVLEASSGAWEKALVLGDLVGYGPDPNEVVERVRELPGLVAVRGNHDRAAVRGRGDRGWNRAARSAALWTRRALSRRSRDFLARLPPGPLAWGEALLVHGSPAEEDAYLLDEEDADRAFSSAAFGLAFFGHTHLPGGFVRRAGRTQILPLEGEGARLRFERGGRYLVGPGSVGQPRDGDPRAAYGLLDAGTGSVSLHRVAYDVETTRRRILDAGLPRSLAERLRAGI